MDPVTTAAAITAAASIGGGLLANRKPKESKMQKTQRHLIDKLIASLGGEGPYKDLYNTDPDVFQKSFVEPAQAMFRNQIAPQIQQQYIASGQQRGTGLDDQLLRAGVEMDQMLNQYLYQSQQDAANRKQSTIQSILGGTAGVQPGMSSSDALNQSTAGYLSSDGFRGSIKDIMKSYTQQTPQQMPGNIPQTPTRRGYEPDWNTAKNMPLGDPRWGA